MTYYRLLGVSPEATPEEIRSAFRRLAKVHHPDTNPNPQSGAQFQVLNEAHRVLSDPDLRRRYDQFLQAQVQRQSLGGGAQLAELERQLRKAMDTVHPGSVRPARRNARADFRTSLGLILVSMLVVATVTFAATRLWVNPGARLDLSYRGLETVPPTILGSREVVWLNLSHNQLQELPPQITSMGGIEMLNVSHNRLRHLPAEVFYLPWLYGLHASYNQLERLPPEILKAQNLKILNLRSNRLRALPPGLERLPHLNRIDLRDNPIRPDTLAALRQRLPRATILGND